MKVCHVKIVCSNIRNYTNKPSSESPESSNILGQEHVCGTLTGVCQLNVFLRSIWQLK